MNNSEIKLQRTQSLLVELVSEALSSLEDPQLNSLSVTKVQCSRGKYHAKVFIESSGIKDDQKQRIMSHLNKASSYLREYVLSASGWFKSPKFSFIFDDELDSQSSLDEIFKKLENERKER